MEQFVIGCQMHLSSFSVHPTVASSDVLFYELLGAKIGWLVVRFVCTFQTSAWLICLNYWLIDWLADWLIWLIDWLNHWLINWVTDWFINWLLGLLVDWLVVCLTDHAVGTMSKSMNKVFTAICFFHWNIIMIGKLFSCWFIMFLFSFWPYMYKILSVGLLTFLQFTENGWYLILFPMSAQKIECKFMSNYFFNMYKHT